MQPHGRETATNPDPERNPFELLRLERVRRLAELPPDIALPRDDTPGYVAEVHDITARRQSS